MDKGIEATEGIRFIEGEYVLYGTSGVCQIEGVTELALPDIPKGKKYFALHPVNDVTAKIYTPVDRTEKIIKIMSRSEAEELVDCMPRIEPLEVMKGVDVEELYKECMRSYNRTRWVSMLKYIYGRKQKRMNQGKKSIAVDEKFMKIAENAVYSELSLVLDIPRDEVEEYISQRIDGALEEKSVK